MSDGNSGLMSTFKFYGTAASVLPLASKYQVCLPAWVITALCQVHSLLDSGNARSVTSVSSVEKMFDSIFKIERQILSLMQGIR